MKRFIESTAWWIRQLKLLWQARRQESDQPRTPAQVRKNLELKAEKAAMVLAMMNTPGWKQFQEDIEDQAARSLEGLLVMKADEFQGPNGAEQKGFARGLQHAALRGSQILQEGREAQQLIGELDEREQRNANQTSWRT